MVTVNQPIQSKLANRKKRIKKTWLEIIERGIESYEVEKRITGKIKEEK